MLLKVFFENGRINVYPLGQQYTIVEVNAVEVLKKHEAYDIMKWIKTYKKSPATRYFVMTENVFPLDKEGSCYNPKSGDVAKYQIVTSSNDIVWEYIPTIEFENDEQRNMFWDTMLRIPLQ